MKENNKKEAVVGFFLPDGCYVRMSEEEYHTHLETISEWFN